MASTPVIARLFRAAFTYVAPRRPARDDRVAKAEKRPPGSLRTAVRLFVYTPGGYSAASASGAGSAARLSARAAAAAASFSRSARMSSSRLEET